MWLDQSSNDGDYDVCIWQQYSLDSSLHSIGVWVTNSNIQFIILHATNQLR